MRIATDIGGTFTDLVYLDEDTGELGLAKSSTTPAGFETGVADALEKAQIDSEQRVSSFTHGSTLVINALTERGGSPTALVTTKGFRDVLELGRSNRPDLFNLRYRKPRPFVERYLRFEVTERVSHLGEVLVPIECSDVEAAVARAARYGVEAFAICFLHSYANPDHELAAAETIRSVMGDAAVTMSHEVCGEWREYERTNTAVLNAYVQELTATYLAALEEILRRRAVRDRIYVMQSNGGTLTVAQAKRRPIMLVESGPVAGVAGAALVGTLTGQPNVISLDIGGTTAKTSLVDRGEMKISTDYRIGWRPDYAGYPIKVPVVDIVEIGAGGGSIAWLDDAGGLSVGPRSAGAVPGPACYPNGGSEPTVTDANLIVGRIDPTYFLGGEMEVSVERASQAMERIARPLGLSVEQAALGVISLANANMVNAIKLVSLRRGYDPRDFDMVAYGGGGSMHASALAHDMHIPRVVVPRLPGVFSAWGMLMTDLRADWVRTRVMGVEDVQSDEIAELWTDLERTATDYFVGEGITGERLVLTRSVDMRYRGQEHTVTVPLGRADLFTEQDEVLARFHAAHEQLYMFRLDVDAEIVNLRLTGFGLLDKPEITRLADAGSDPGRAARGTRSVHFGDDVHEVMTFERSLLGPGMELGGPAVVAEPESSTVVFPGQRLVVDDWGQLLITTTDGKPQP